MTPHHTKALKAQDHKRHIKLNEFENVKGNLNPLSTPLQITPVFDSCKDAKVPKLLKLLTKNVGEEYVGQA